MSAFEKYGTVISLDWRPGEPICCTHPAAVPVADILLLQAIGQPTKIIYADKMFGAKFEDCPGNMEIWKSEDTKAVIYSKKVYVLKEIC